MSEQVTYKASIVCEQTGKDYTLEGTIDNDLYVRSSDREIHNHLLIQLLKRYPNIDVGDLVGSSIQTPHNIADDREQYARLVG